MIEDCKGVDKSINEVVLVPELAALLQSFACLVASSGSTDCRTLNVSVGGRLLVLGASQPTDNELSLSASSGVFLNLESQQRHFFTCVHVT